MWVKCNPTQGLSVLVADIRRRSWFGCSKLSEKSRMMIMQAKYKSPLIGALFDDKQHEFLTVETDESLKTGQKCLDRHQYQICLA
jgi:hypothetical protein